MHTSPERPCGAPAFVLLSFEGPDAYSRAGGLGTRVSGLASALAEEGYGTQLFYIGSPDLAGHEVGCGGSEAHGREVRARARAAGLEAANTTCRDSSAAALCRAIAASHSNDIVFVQSTLSRPQLQSLYRASDGVLANSGIEPFGLVGLEAMACGGLSFLGATGEDYATPGHDAISLQSSLSQTCSGCASIHSLRKACGARLAGPPRDSRGDRSSVLISRRSCPPQDRGAVPAQAS